VSSIRNYKPREILVGPDDPAWGLIGAPKPLLNDGRQRDPFWEEGCHPDVVERVWAELGDMLPTNCRAQANGTPVLADPVGDRIFAAAHGTAYALWLVPTDFDEALGLGAKTTMTWSNGGATDLVDVVGVWWIWGPCYAKEPAWLMRAYETTGSGPSALT
jgi:hypothetical protein